MDERTEYERFHIPDEYERKLKLEKRRIDVGKSNNFKIKRNIVKKNILSKKRMLSETYGI